MVRERIGRIVGAVVLIILLTACGLPVAGPNRQLVERAIALQFQQTQSMLSQQLRLTEQPTAIDIHRVVITDQTPLKIDNLPSFQVRGTYNVTIKLPTRQITEQQNPFEVYLQRQVEGKTWKLARLATDDEGQSTWLTQGME